jgi:hypothetical protein
MGNKELSTITIKDHINNSCTTLVSVYDVQNFLIKLNVLQLHKNYSLLGKEIKRMMKLLEDMTLAVDDP